MVDKKSGLPLTGKHLPKFKPVCTTRLAYQLCVLRYGAALASIRRLYELFHAYQYCSDHAPVSITAGARVV